MTRTVEVHCAAGRVALPRRYGAGPDGAPIELTADPATARQLPLDGFVRRQLRRGVFVECNRASVFVESGRADARAERPKPKDKREGNQA